MRILLDISWKAQEESGRGRTRVERDNVLSVRR